MTDPIRSALKRLLSAVLDGLGQDDHPMGWARVDDAIDAARAALAEPGPEDDVALLRETLAATAAQRRAEDDARAVLARWGRYDPPAAGEVSELVDRLRHASDGASAMGWEQDSWVIARAADLLAQRPEPVPVEERPWEREGWCDERGRCWFGAPEFCADDAIWTLHPPAERLSKQTVCLPANALPLPAGEVE